MDKALRLQAEIKKVFGDTPVNLVGGSVRDIVLNKEPKDWDYCTPMLPDDIEAAVKAYGRRPYISGKKFGTVGFKIELDGVYHYIEVTTYRTEVYANKSRKPEVEFINDLDADLSRRDFTINAMVLKEDGSIYDPYGGRIDILARQIKTVGKPKDRIQEDPLRMLRGARFASQLDFSLDPNMIGKMRQVGSTITNVSKERWVQELDKLLMGKNVMRGIKVLMQSEIAKYVLPEMYLSLKNDDEAYQALTDAFNKKDMAMDLDSRWAAIHYFIGLPYSETQTDIIRKELMQGICARLKFSNDRRDNLVKNKIIWHLGIDL